MKNHFHSAVVSILRTKTAACVCEWFCTLWQPNKKCINNNNETTTARTNVCNSILKMEQKMSVEKWMDEKNSARTHTYTEEMSENIFQKSSFAECGSVKHLANRSAKMTCLELMADNNYSENKRIKLISGKSFARIMVTLILLATATTKAHAQRAESKVKFGWP